LNGKDTKTFIEFVDAFEIDAATRRWIMPIALFLSRTEHTTERQQLLQYGVVVHALIDTLDPDHLVTRERPSMPNKLSKRSWTGLNYRVFGVYLKFVKNRQKYLGPPKRATRTKKVRQAAGIEDVRIHDLRHSFASIAVSGGLTLPLVGKLLGHKKSTTTERYAHLADDPLRAANEEVAQLLGRSFKRSVGSEG